MRTKEKGKGKKPAKKARAPKSAAQRIKEGKVELSEKELGKVSGGAVRSIIVKDPK